MPHSTGLITPDAELGAHTVSVRFSAPGFLPGTDYRRTIEALEAELSPPHLSGIPELAHRGHHGTVLGRTIAQLSELYAELTSYGWRLVPAPGADHMRTVSLLNADVNTVADVRGERAENLNTGASGVKLELLGPVSLAAQLHLPGGEKALADPGAYRDLADSLAAGIPAQLAQIRGAVGAARVEVAVCEPDYWRVRAGSVATVSGYQHIRSLPRDVTRSLVNVVVDSLRTAGADRVFLDFGHPAQGEHVEDFRGPGSAAVDGFALPVLAADSHDWERAAEVVEGGAHLLASVLAPGELSRATVLPEVSQLAARLTHPWDQLGMEPTDLASFTLSGLGAADRYHMAPVSDSHAMSAVTRLLDTAEALTEQIQT